MLPFYQNIPFFTILLSMVCGLVTAAFKNGRAAFRLHIAMLTLCTAASAYLTVVLSTKSEAFTYMMGHYPAPWGNELRSGPLEAMLATVFCLVMGLCVLGGLKDIFDEILPEKQPLYFVMLNLLLASLLALVYTNDLFTAYVFIEINTIASCAIVMAKDTGHTNMATLRYMIMSQLGSGLFLLAVSILYGITGQLLMPSLQPAISALNAAGEYALPFTVVTGFLVLGLSIKSALYPFHTWLPGAHGSATTASSAILSGLVLKGYIVLLIKILYRVYTLPVVRSTHVLDVLFVLGVVAMFMGSWFALQENHMKRMIAYSSVAQIGYIYLGIGMGVEAGLVAAVFHILAHAFTKPLLFVSAGELISLSGHRKQMYYLRGSALRAPLAGAAFTLGGLSMVGIPLLGGFVTKMFLASAATFTGWQLYLTFGILAVSSVMNAMYYLPVILLIWSPGNPLSEEAWQSAAPDEADDELTQLDISLPLHPAFAFSCVSFMAGVVCLGVFYIPIAEFISRGLTLL